MLTFMDESLAREIEGLDDPTDLDFHLEALEAEIRKLEWEMLEEEREHAIRQRFLAEISKERVNLGRNYRVNWLKEGF